MGKDEIIILEDSTLEKLIADSVKLIEYARQCAVKQVNMVQLLTYYALGRWIVEEEASGE